MHQPATDAVDSEVHCGTLASRPLALRGRQQTASRRACVLQWPHLVQQDKGGAASGCEDAGQPAHVPAEGGQALLQILAVPYVRQYAVKPLQAGPGGRMLERGAIAVS